MNETATRVRDPEATKARLLQAATEEFAAHGIAGARIDRIAAAAKVNKAQIYSYYGDKDQLFDFVLDTHVSRVLDQVPFSAADLPGYAGRLFDHLITHPHQHRLASWHRLERGGGRPATPGLLASVRDKVAEIAHAQAEGQLPATLTAEDLVAFTIAVVTAWLPSFSMPLGGQAGDDLGRRRQAIMQAVTLLTGG